MTELRMTHVRVRDLRRFLQDLPLEVDLDALVYLFPADLSRGEPLRRAFFVRSHGEGALIPCDREEP